MKHVLPILCALAAGMIAAPATADVRELGRGELRENVRQGKSMSLSRLIQVISSRIEGEVVDVRAFESDDIFYRVILKGPDGRLMAAIVDANSGRFVSSESEVVREIMAAAKSNNGSSGKSKGRGPSNAGGKGNNAGGNGNSGNNGNSGGNGGGNSGGNGGGNSGGNGGGNSGGSGGGGNSGGKK